MHLDKIEIKGFKSFRDKTEIEFPSKFTTIVGPNGSGKSNITEAVCFVLGRSRGLRASNLQELIFNGGKDGSPSKKAVVSIHLREEDGRLHTISRMVDVEGHSMYKIDGKRMTRQHVLDMLGDNEYNIILQDDVTKVIDMRPTERRQVIDELCGIAEYDKKKDKALKELSKVEDRIGDTHIILGEKQGYLNKLRRERDDAIKYNDVKQELSQNRASLLNHDILLYKKRVERHDQQCLEAETAKSGLQDRINKIRGEIETKRAELKSLNNRIIDLEDGRSRSRYAELKEDIARKESVIQTLEERISEGASEVESNKKRVEESKLEEARVESRLSEIEGEIKTLSTDIEDERKELGDPRLEEKIDALKETVFKARSQMEGLAENIESLSAKRATLAGLKTELDGRTAETADKLESLEKKLERSKDAFDSKAKERQRLNDELTQLEEKLSAVQHELEETQLAHARKKTELKTIEESGGGVHGAEKAVMRLKDVMPGIHGPVSQLGQVTQDEYETALLVASGNRMHYIIVDNVDVAAKCIDYLKKKEIGRSTFLPLSKIKAKLGKKLPANAIGFARDYIKCDRKYAAAFEYILGDTLIVDAAKKIGVGEYRMVTLDGSLFEVSGALTGGHMKKGVEVGFSNLEELEKDIEVLEDALNRKTEERDKLLSGKDDLKRDLIKLDPELNQLQFELEEARLEFERRTQIGENTGGELARVGDEITDIDRESAEKHGARDRLEELIEKTGRELAPLSEEKRKYNSSRFDELKDKKRDLDVEAGGLRERGRLLKTTLAEIEGDIRTYGINEQRWRDDITEVEGGLKQLRDELSGVEKESASLVGEIRALINKRSDIEDRISRLGVKVGEIEHEMHGVGEQISRAQIERAKLDAELETLERELAKFEGVELVERKVGEMRGMVERLEKKLEEFGAINMKAIETYDKVKTEYDDIMEKLETLKNERQSIFDFMEEVERKKYDTFTKTFKVVKENFERIFHELSNGEGTLLLDNPKEISESGLLIKASPEDKKIMSLDAMSGGEKVLTSAAFLLAIQQYKPAFFYIVDELDAALDKTNSTMLAKMLAASDSQFILVTHNNAMMQFAESVIGVSMRDGVSQIVGVKLDSTLSD